MLSHCLPCGKKWVPAVVVVWAVCLAFTAAPCLADPYTWIVTDGNWSDSASWDNGIPPASNQTILYFANDASVTYTSTNDFSGERVIEGIILSGGITSATGTNVITGNPIDVRNSGNLISNQNSSAVDWDLQVDIGFFPPGNQLKLTGNGTTAATISGNIRAAAEGTGTVRGITKNGSTTWIVTGDIESTIDGPINVYAGVLDLRGTANAFTGPVTVNGGVLVVGDPGALPVDVAVNSGGTFDANGQNLQLRSFTIAGSGESGYVGALVNTSASDAATVGGVTLSGDASIGATSSTLNVNGTLNGGGYTLTVAGSGQTHVVAANGLTNLAGITVSSGRLQLDANQSWTGAITVSSGAVVAGGGSGTRDVYSELILDGGTVAASTYTHWNGTITLTADSYFDTSGGRIDTFGTIVGGTYVLTKTGNTESAIRGGVTSLGGLVVDGGRLRLENTGLGTWTGPVTVNSGGTLSAWGNHTTVASVTLAGGTLAAENSGTSIYNGPVTVTADSTIYTGSGNVQVGGGLSGSGNLTVTGSYEFQVNASGSVGGIRGSGNLVLGSGVNLAVGSNNDDNIWTGTTSGSGTLQKVGSGLLAMSNTASTYSGGTVIAAGNVASLAPGALGTGTVTLAGGTLNLASPVPALANFGGSGTGWTLNGSASASGDVLTVTTNGGSQAGSAFYDLPVATSDFVINFTYGADLGSSNPADGLTVVFQTDLRGQTALGASGGSLGYGGSSSINPSAAIAFNLYSNNTRGLSNQVWTNGSTSGGYGATGSIDLYGSPVDVELSYSGTTLTATLTQGTEVFTTTYTVDLESLLGTSAFFGFTGGTGGQYARQQVSDFTYYSTYVPDTAYANDLAVSAGVVGNLDLLVTSAAPAYSMGGLTMGSDATLSVALIDGSSTDMDYSLTLGATTLDGPATFEIANNGTGTGTLHLGAVAGSGTLTKTGAGTLSLAAASSYSGDTTISEGTLALAAAGSIDATPTITVDSGAVFDVTAKSGDYHLLTGQTLQGAGTVAGGLNVDLGATLAPGLSPGQLTVEGDVTFVPGSTFSVELDGTTPGTEYDQLVVTGDVYLGDATLELLLGFEPNVYSTFTIVDNQGGNPVDGVFDGLVQGSSVFATYDSQEYEFVITYRGGDGNDVVLTAVPEPSTVAMLVGLAGIGLLSCLRRRRRNESA